eukprot:1000472-Rhodomonas_salina.1
MHDSVLYLVEDHAVRVQAARALVGGELEHDVRVPALHARHRSEDELERDVAREITDGRMGEK